MDLQLSAGWDVDDPSGRPRPVHTVVAQWALDTPDAPAITYAGNTLTYRELDESANRLAHHLRSLGVGKDVVVAIHLARGLDHYVALLAVLKAGGAALPLDTTYPEARLRFMLADSGARVLVTRETSGVPAIGATSTVVRVDVDVDADAELIAARPATAPPGDVAPTDLAYVMYTSASTGNPKGVLLEHGGIANLCRWHIAALGLTSADRGSLAAPLSFDASILDLWPMLVAGGRTVAIDDGARADLAGLVRSLRDNRVTVCFLTTALAEIFLAQPGLDELSLRYLVTGGEALRRRPRPGLPFRLINIYGPTETTVYVTSIVVADAATDRDGGPIPIGYPIGGVGVRLLDEHGRPVPDGEPGEVVVSGPGVARGYLGQPELTERRFRPDESGGPPGARCYRTGDLARLRADGAFEYLGRLDRQLKVRGHRIEPEEIERVLLRHRAVRQAAVTAVRPTPDTAHLVAYVETDREWSPANDPTAPPETREPGEASAPGEHGAGDLATLDTLGDLRRDSIEPVLIDCPSARPASLDRLTGDLARAVELTAAGGAVVAAGVRSLPLLPAAYAVAELDLAPDDMTTEELRWRVHGRIRADAELAVHPAAFAALARLDRVAAVDVVPRYERPGVPRYDVVLQIGDAGPPIDVHWLDWSRDRLDLTAIRKLLRAEEHEALGVRAVPNALVLPGATAWAHAHTAETAGEIRRRSRADNAGGTDNANGTDGTDAPTQVDLLALAVGVPYRTRLSWAAGRPDGSIDVVWVRGADRPIISWPAPDAAPADLANRPSGPAVDAALRRELRDLLAARFVAHELPDLLVVLDRLPLTPVGKVDRDALPLPGWLTGARTESDPPRTQAEAAVAALVVDVLGRSRVGRMDNLVDLGADSLTLAQLAARIAGRFGVELPMRRLLAGPTVEAVAAEVVEAIAADPRRRKEVA